MAHVNRKSTPKEMVLYAIVSPQDHKVYVNSTGVKRLYKTYVEHVNLRVRKTASLFETAKDVGILPPIYVLDTCIVTPQEAFSRCVAWTRYFCEHGHEQVSKDILSEYAEDLVPKTQAYYDTIRNKSLEEVLSPTGGCYPNYTTNNQKSEGKSTERRCTICVTDQEYEKIRKLAKENGMSVSQYCRKMALNGRILHANLGFMGTLMSDYKQVKVMLQQIMHNIYIVGDYLPADMINIQKCIDHVTEIHLEMIEKMNQLIETMME